MKNTNFNNYFELCGVRLAGCQTATDGNTRGNSNVPASNANP